LVDEAPGLPATDSLFRGFSFSFSLPVRLCCRELLVLADCHPPQDFGYLLHAIPAIPGIKEILLVPPRGQNGCITGLRKCVPHPNQTAEESENFFFFPTRPSYQSCAKFYLKLSSPTTATLYASRIVMQIIALCKSPISPPQGTSYYPMITKPCK